LFNCYELSGWFYIHGKKQLHEVIDTSSETLNRHRIPKADVIRWHFGIQIAVAC
jgi:hypothetical protein